MSMITVNILNPIKKNIIESVPANSKGRLIFEDKLDSDGEPTGETYKILETHIIVNVELDEDNNPIFDSDITGRKIDM